MKNLIESYIHEHKNAWSESTQRSERYRLTRILEAMDAGPQSLWDQFGKAQLGKYSKVTYWTRAVDFYDWLIREGHKSGPNPFAEWRKKNALQFKHVYQRRQPDCTYREARERIETIRDKRIREACLFLLEGGLRHCEISTFDPTSKTVVGKGKKERRVYASYARGETPSYARVYRSLRAVGLKPHDLRKLAAGRFRDLGFREEDFLKMMGWESFETAKAYLKPKREEEIEALIKQNVA